MSDTINMLMTFLDSAPTSYHAASVVTEHLTSAGFTELREDEPWSDLPDIGVVRRDGAVLAWRAPTSARGGLRIYAAHTDSPCFKIKPSGEFTSAGFSLTTVEAYGGGILHSWMDRDLRLAGRVVDADGNVHLVSRRSAAIIPSLAIHLDRGVNETLELDKQTDLVPVFGLDQTGSMTDSLADLIGSPDVLGADLFLVSDEKPRVVGLDDSLLAAPRLDNLASVYAGMIAMLASAPSDDWQLFVALDHEEIGSATASGAVGTFLSDILERIASLRHMSRDQYGAWLAQGVALSADVTHAVHPTHAAHYDSHTHATIDAGPAIKWSAPMRYATDAVGQAVFTRACRAAGVEMQQFVNHPNIPGGSTIGSILATRLGIRTIDAGMPLLAMHSVRELCSVNQPMQCAAVAKAFLAAE